MYAADYGGTSDPYLVFESPVFNAPYCTKYKRKTLNPGWKRKECPEITLERNNHDFIMSSWLLIRVVDFDLASQDDPIGKLKSDMSLTIKGTVACLSQSSKTLIQLRSAS